MFRGIHSSVFNGDDVKYPTPQKNDDSSEKSGQRTSFVEDYASINRKETSQSSERSIFIMRHGERVDFVFGTWIPYCFDDGDNYIRRDLNMPKSLPRRRNGPNGYLLDSPLTILGIFQASTIGEALLAQKADIRYIYSSPAFRSIQTAAAILHELDNNSDLKIRIEPGLFEMPLWYEGHKLDWMSAEELSEAGYKIDVEYQPIFSVEDIKKIEEDYAGYYKRGFIVSKAVLENNIEGNILFVGHSSTLDNCSRELIGQKPRDSKELFDVITKIPYCGIVQLNCINNKWQLVEPCLPLTHGRNPRYDWRIMRS